MDELRDTPVAVLCGGIGAEREVSLISGEAVYQALATQPDGSKRANVKKIILTGATDEIAALKAEYAAGRGIAFLALHGEYGEDGTVQRELEKHGIIYTGSDAAGSALAMDKSASKRTFSAHQVPVAAGFTVDKNSPAATASAVLEKMKAEKIALPVVVKPNGRGSSVGVTIVRDAEQLPGALEAALKEDTSAIVEQYVHGTEITVSLLDGEPLPIVELVPQQEFYDYQAKYLADTTQYFCPARLDEATTEKVRRLAVAGWNALGLRDMARIDFIIGSENDAGRIIAIEANTLPGMTSHSLLPKAAGAAGMDFATLCWKIVELAKRRK